MGGVFFVATALVRESLRFLRAFEGYFVATFLALTEELLRVDFTGFAFDLDLDLDLLALALFESSF